MALKAALSFNLRLLHHHGHAMLTSVPSTLIRLPPLPSCTIPLRPCHSRTLPFFSSPSSSRRHALLLCRASEGVATEAGVPGSPLLSGDKEASPGNNSWNIKMLYDGDCPLCMREVNMLRERNKSYGAIKFVDITADNYDAKDNNDIDFEMAMGRIHAIRQSGEVLTNVAAFRALYEEVGLGWVYAITNHEPWASMADAVYSFWAKYRLPVTGRPPLEEILEKRRQRKVEDNSCSIKDGRCRTE